MVVAEVDGYRFDLLMITRPREALRSFVFLFFALLASSALSALTVGSESGKNERPRPNILFIVLDDLGFNDLGANSASVGHTPNLNQLASQGARFTRNYVDSTCSATRAGILTGRYPASLGFRPAGRGISPEVITLPDMLRAAGYTTHHVGKWHLGFASDQAWPIQQGFDSFFGFLDQFLLRGPHTDAGYNLKRPTYVNPLLQRDNGAFEQQSGHLSDILVEEAIDLLGRIRDQEQPWFINYWTYLPHTPLRPATRFARKFPDTPEGKYNAMLMQVDAAVGRVLATLDASDLTRSTLVILVSDNGGTEKQLQSNKPFIGVKNTFTEGGLRTPLLMRWSDVIPKNVVIDETVSYLDYFPTLESLVTGHTSGGLPGRNLWPLFFDESIQRKALYWQNGPPRAPSWSLLNRDGDQRITRSFGMDPELLELAADPDGHVRRKVSAGSADIGDLQNQFRDWHVGQRELKTLNSKVNAQGAGTLTGDLFQRSLGFNGFTFAIPIKRSAEVTPLGRQLIAGQQGHWQMYIENNRLVANVLGVEVEAEAPDVGECSKIILTGYFNHAFAFPSDKRATLMLYVDQKRVDSAVINTFELPLEGYELATTLGHNRLGQSRFSGFLGRPVILNEMLLDHSSSDAWLDNSVSALSTLNCERAVRGVF
ncbi:sulfatase family protein [Luminiphilus sp. nBUS_07]|uniref:sulfatase family protein n=1 Tax=Luminiphilus sp. nBUS_07 TaxID=3395314 RepID=UPI003EC059CC